MGDGKRGAEEREKECGGRKGGRWGRAWIAEIVDSGGTGRQRGARGAAGWGRRSCAGGVGGGGGDSGGFTGGCRGGPRGARRGAAQLAQGGNGAGRAPRARAVLPWSCPRSGSKRSTGT